MDCIDNTILDAVPRFGHAKLFRPKQAAVVRLCCRERYICLFPWALVVVIAILPLRFDILPELIPVGFLTLDYSSRSDNELYTIGEGQRTVLACWRIVYTSLECLFGN